MKKRIIAFSVVIIMMTNLSIGAGARPIPESIVSSFNHEFEDASNTKWTITNDYFKAMFTINSDLMEAFYTYDGELVAISKKLRIDQLPLLLLEKAKEKIGAYTLSDVFQLTTDKGLEYFISFERENEKMIYKSIGNKWSRY